MSLYLNNKNKTDVVIGNTDVLLTNGWDRIAFNVLKGLVKENLNVAFGTDEFLGMGRFSKSVKNKFIHPDYLNSEKEFIETIKNAINLYRPKVFIPTGEEIYTISKNIDKFRNNNIRIPVADYNILDSLNDKSSSYKIANSIGIPIPATIKPITKQDILDFAKEYSFPVVLKNIKSNSSQGVFFLTKHNIDKILEVQIAEKGTSLDEFILQQFIEGVGYGVSGLFNNGNPKALFTHKRIRERIKTGGPSTLRISTENREIEEYAISLLKSVKFHGVAMVEFKYNEKMKKGWFIEVNPRFWGSVGLAVNSGVNFPYLLYRMALDGDIDHPVFEYNKGVTEKWLIGDINAILKDVLTEKNIFRIKDIFKKSDYYDDFDKDDILPFFARIYLQLRRKIIKTIYAGK